MSYRILVADDHSLVRSAIVSLLNELSRDHEALEARSGEEVLQILQTQRVDGLLLDLNMPHFDPIADLKRIQALQPRLPVLVITAHDDPVYIQALLEAGVCGYHLKSQPIEELKVALERLLAGERWIAGPVIERLLRRPAVPDLSERQIDLLRLLAQGLDNVAIAQTLHLSVKTVENNLTRLYRRLNVSSRLEAVSIIREHPHWLHTDQPVLPTTKDHVVLLVDDSDNYRLQMRRTLRRMNANLHFAEAASTAEAVEIVQQEPPQLALIDMLLGDENGIECLRQVKQIVPQARLILISAYPDYELRRQGMAAGASAFIDKRDLNAAALRQIVDDLSR